MATYKYAEVTRQNKATGNSIYVVIGPENTHATNATDTLPLQVQEAVRIHCQQYIAKHTEVGDNGVVFPGGKLSVFPCLVFVEAYETWVEPSTYFMSRLN